MSRRSTTTKAVADVLADDDEGQGSGKAEIDEMVFERSDVSRDTLALPVLHGGDRYASLKKVPDKKPRLDQILS